jgi:hypothetical protein
MNANERQVGGNHYQAPFQHWDLVQRLGLGYFEGQVTKYVTRHRKKNGRQDAEKALHFLEKLIELSHQDLVRAPRPPSGTDTFNLLDYYASSNGLTTLEDTIIRTVSTWFNPIDLRNARRMLVALIADSYPEPPSVSGTATSTPRRRSYEQDTSKTHDDGSEPGAGYVNQDR